MLDENRNVIYIGKSINIKRRVSSYFNPSAKCSKKTTKMINHIHSFNIFYTDTELDALLLECRWIKGYKPFYNTALTRDYEYIYLDVYEEPYYLIKTSKKTTIAAAIRIGPFTSHRLAIEGLQYIKTNYAYLGCDFKYKNNVVACYPYQFAKCNGVCLTNYKKNERDIIEEILGEESKVIEEICHKIEVFSENMEYERAANLLKQKSGMRYLQVMYGFLQRDKQTRNLYRGFACCRFKDV